MIDQNGIKTWDGLMIRWDEIVDVCFYKIDAITEEICYLTFQHESGEDIEFTNDDPDFDSTLESLPLFLTLQDGWRDLINAARVDGEEITLLEKI